MFPHYLYMYLEIKIEKGNAEDMDMSKTLILEP